MPPAPVGRVLSGVCAESPDKSRHTFETAQRCHLYYLQPRIVQECIHDIAYAVRIHILAEIQT